MNTFILMWNPAISSYSLDDFRKDMNCFTRCCVENDEEVDEEENENEEEDDDEYYGSPRMNWDVYEHEKAEEGDRFFLVRVGDGNTGVVASGFFSSDPYPDDDWRGSDRQRYYMEMDVDTIIDVDMAPHISTEQLTQAMPDFNWNGGHSGRKLRKDFAEKLEAMWFEYLYENCEIFDNVRAYRDDYFNDDYINETLMSHLVRTRDNACEVCGYDFKKIWGKDMKVYNDYYLYRPNNLPRTASPEDNVWKHVHCVCDNCRKLPSEVIVERLHSKKESI